MIARPGTCYGIDVPGHIEEELEIVGSHFGVVDIGYPQPSHVVIVGLTQFIVDESRLGGRQPEVVVRPAPIRKMVIDACSTAALLFAGIGEPGDVAIIVIAPHQRDIIGYFQPLLVELQHFLVGNEHLHLLGWIADVFPDQSLLIVDHLLQGFEFLLFCLVALHRTVVDATHADREHIVVRMLHFFLSLGPVLPDSLTVRAIVEGPASVFVPLAYVVAEQRLTVAGTHHDAKRVGGCFGARREEEGHCALVHGRPDGVGTQAEQQLEDLSIGARADLSLCSRFESLIAPRAQRPVFVVQEDASELHTGALLA